MIQIPTRINFSEMTFVQILIVILKFVVYFDYTEIEELYGKANSSAINFTQFGGGDSNNSSSNVGSSTPAPPPSSTSNAPPPAATNAPPPAATNAPPPAGDQAAQYDPTALFKQASGLNTTALSSIGNISAAGLGAPQKEKADALAQGLNADLSKDKDLKGIKKGFLQNNLVTEMVKQAYSIFVKVGKIVGEIVSRLVLIFIFAATFPVLPFFAVMGLVYAFAKYGAFKFRGL